MTVASIETTLELWASSLRDVKTRIRPLFTQERVAFSVGQFLDSLLTGERRKTGWMRAEAAGDPGPWRQQAILGRGCWDADALRDIVREYALETLADANATLVLDETDFLKQGRMSCGVARQYTESAGRVTNCQIGIFASYVSCHGDAFVDRALYLPKSWTDDPTRLARAHVPDGTGFATKPAIALSMVKRAIAADVPFRWVTADSIHSGDAIKETLRRAGKSYVLGVNADHRFRSLGEPRAISETAGEIAGDLPEDAWWRPSTDDCTKGEWLYDWAYVKLADQGMGCFGNAPAETQEHGLLVRRTVANGDLAFFSAWCPAGTTIGKLIEVEGYRQTMKDATETAKSDFGLDHNETRSWHGWHRHVSLVMLAFAMMASIHHRTDAMPRLSEKTLRKGSGLRP